MALTGNAARHHCWLVKLAQIGTKVVEDKLVFGQKTNCGLLIGLMARAKI